MRGFALGLMFWDSSVLGSASPGSSCWPEQYVIIKKHKMLPKFSIFCFDAWCLDWRMISWRMSDSSELEPANFRKPRAELLTISACHGSQGIPLWWMMPGLMHDGSTYGWCFGAWVRKKSARPGSSCWPDHTRAAIILDRCNICITPPFAIIHDRCKLSRTRR